MRYAYGEETGKLCTCQICGSQVFLKRIGETTADGGWTHIDNYEPYPDGWGLVPVPNFVKNIGGNVHNGYLRACPTCYARWEMLMNEGYLKGTPYYKKEN